MALFNYATRELSAKIVYYGPGLSGKTTNIEMVHRILRPEQKGRLISLPTETDRTLFFDFLPVDLGQIKGFKVRFHLYTVPGQVFYNATRRLVLQGVDGVVFVADSQADMAQSNVDSLKNLVENLGTYGKKIEDLPFVLQYNKRDLKQVLPVAEMNARLNPRSVPVVEGIAKDGVGVSETLVTISRMVFSFLRKTLLMPGEAAEHEEIAELADVKIRESLGRQEAEPLEEISDIEEIEEEKEIQEPTPPLQPPPVPEPPLLPETPSPAEEPARQDSAAEAEEQGGLAGTPPPGEAATSAGGGMLSGLDEIEIEIPEPLAPAAKTARSEISLETEEGGLTFLKFDNPYVSPEGHAVLPAVFLDSQGNIVRLRFRISMEE